jgi:hypothetical protein
MELVLKSNVDGDKYRKYRTSKKELVEQLNEYTIKRVRGLGTDANDALVYIKEISKSVQIIDGVFIAGSILHVKEYLKKYEPMVLLDVKNHLDAETLCITENLKSDAKQLKQDLSTKALTAVMKDTLTSFTGYNIFQLTERLRDIECETMVLKHHIRRLTEQETKANLLQAKTVIDTIMDDGIAEDEELVFV